MKVFSAFLLISLLPSIALAQSSQHVADVLYAGTVPGNGSKGIYVLKFDRSKHQLNELQTLEGKKNPNFLALHPSGKCLYAIYAEGMTAEDKRGTVSAFTIDPASGKIKALNEQSTEGRGPAHVSVDPKGRFAYVANYGEGSFAVYPLLPDGSLGKARQVVKYDGSGYDTALQKHPFVHSVIPSADGKFIYVSCLGLDKIMIYQVRDTGDFLPAATPFASSTPGAGPRHLVIHPSGRFAFSVEEISSSVASYRRDVKTGALTPMERFQMVPDSFKGGSSGADIHLSPDGRFLYASVRDLNNIAIYAVNQQTGKLSFVAREDGHGNHPRNFCVDKKGQYVFVENMKSNNIAIFKRDGNTGRMEYLRMDQIPGVACLIQY